MKFKEIKKIIYSKKCDFAVFASLGEDYDRNIFYFTGYKGIGFLIIPKNSRPFLLVPSMEYLRAKNNSNVNVRIWEKKTNPFEEIGKALKIKKNMGKRYCFCYRDIYFNNYLAMRKVFGAKTQDITKDCLQIRSLKDKTEINTIKKACKINDAILLSCIQKIMKFNTEKEAENYLRIETLKKGCTLAFPPIVASGVGGSMPHYEAKGVSIRKGFCIIDFGVRYNGYHSDITRTIYIGKPSKEELRMYQMLLAIQKRAISSIKIGRLCKDLHLNVKKELGKYEGNFNHGLGHGLGVEIHEYPNLTPFSEDVFCNGQVFTIEPGVYFENKYGIRIEDDIAIKDGKPIILTKTPKKLIVKEKRIR